MSLNKNYLVANVFFLLSGVSSLVYQIIWTRELVFVFGSTTFATSTVLSVFMGGLAIGSFAAGKYVDVVKRPFFLYGILEGAIGLWALLAPTLFELCIPIYRANFEHLHQQALLFGLLRFVASALILIIPTSCMGATLPLLSKCVTQSINEVGNRVGSLYAINTLGAVIGAIVAGFILIPKLGLHATTLIAVSINFLLAVSVACMGRQEGSDLRSTQQPSAVSASHLQNQNYLSSETKAATICLALSGALAMTYEVAWTRSLLMVIGSTTYAFTVMLSTFLIGIALGSYISARIVDRLKNKIAWLAGTQTLLCLAGFFSIVFFNYLPGLNLTLARFATHDSGSSNFLRFLAAGTIMVPITLCLGFMFPLAIKMCASNLQNIGKSIGSLYAANTCGAIVGAFIAGFIIIPAMGTEQTLAFTSLCNLLIGMCLLFLFGGIRRPLAIFGLTVSAAAFVLLFTSGIHIWNIIDVLYAQSDRRQLVQGSSHRRPSLEEDDWLEPKSFTRASNFSSFPELLFYKEGPCANVAVTQASPAALGKITTLFTNGHADASDSLDMENQALLAALPLVLKPKSESVCVVGWGSGVTSGYGLLFPVKSLITSEIEPLVAQTSRYFHHVNFRPENDRRSIIEPSDGRNYLLGTGKKFDVIISEPSNPWQSGVCNLFTHEYFKISSDALKPGGLFCMWNQINEMPIRNLEQVYAALLKIYPEVFVFESGTGDTIAIASKTELVFNMTEINQALNLPSVKTALAKFRIRSAADMIARIRACPEGLRRGTKGAQANSDDMNHLEFDLGSSYESRSYAQEDDQWFLSNAGPIWKYIDWQNMSPEDKAKEMLQIAKACLPSSPERFQVWAEQSIKTKPTPQAYSLISELQISLNDPAHAKSFATLGLSLFPDDAALHGIMGVAALREGDYSSAQIELEKARQLNPANSSFCYYLAVCHSALNLGETGGQYKVPPSIEPRTVIDLCQKAAKDSNFLRRKPGIVLMLADAYNSEAKYDQSIICLTQLIEKRPDMALAWRLLSRSYEGKNNRAQAEYCQKHALLVFAKQADSVWNKAQLARKTHNYLEASRQAQHILDYFPNYPEASRMLSESNLLLKTPRHSSFNSSNNNLEEAKQ